MYNWLGLNKHIPYLSSYIKYFYHKIIKTQIFQSFISRFYGISIAQKNHQTLEIKYIFEGKQYTIYAPFEKRLINKMINTNVEMEYAKFKHKIIQQPGVPYLIAPKHLGATSATVYSLDEIKTVHHNEKIEV